MTTMTKRLFLTLAATLTLLWAAPGVSRAQVDKAYLCDVEHQKNEGSYFGEAGYLVASYYSAPNCTGSYLGYHYYCSKGAVGGYCAAGTQNLFRREELLALRHELLEHAHGGYRITSFNTPCNNGDTKVCARIIRFHMYW
jgi:hypothetical protein